MGTLRVTGGSLRGRRLRVPPGRETRPTSDKVREAIFDILGPRAAVGRVADLFAGSGALGIEALSRGAGHCLFVELRRFVLRVLAANLEALGLQERSTVLRADAAAASRRLLGLGPVELILADPPYDRGFVARVVRLAGRAGLLAPGGWLVLEHSPRERPPQVPELVCRDRRAYGQTEVSLLERGTTR